MSVPLTHARIGYRTITRTPGAVISATGTAGGSSPLAAANELTYEGWIPAASGDRWEVESPAPVTLGYWAIAAHTLGSRGATVHLQWHDGMDWITWETIAPDHDGPIMRLLPGLSGETRWGVQVEYAGEAPVLGVVFIGQTLEMARPIYGGHSPMALSADAEIEPQQSEGGQLIGRSVLRTGEVGEFAWQHLDPAWYRQHFAPFARYASEGRGAFFIAWRPSSYPDEVAYGWATAPIQPQNMGVADLMSVSLSMRGHATVAARGEVYD